jgi:hypothetical protein
MKLANELIEKVETHETSSTKPVGEELATDKDVVAGVGAFSRLAQTEIKEIEYQLNLLKKLNQKPKSDMEFDWKSHSDVMDKLVRSLNDISKEAKSVVSLIEYR